MKKARFSIGILFFICGLNFATWATRIPDFKSFLSLSDAQLGTVLMGLPIGSLVSLPIAGWLLTKYASRWICIMAIVLYVIVIPSLSLLSSPVTLFIGLFFFGMAGDIMNIAMNTQVVSLEAKMNKIIMSSFHAVFSIGLMAGAFLGGILEKEHFTTTEHFSLVALSNILLIPFSFPNLLTDKPVQDKSKPKSSILNLGPYLIILSFIAFCGMLCEGAMADWISLYFKEYSPDSPFPITIGFSFFAAAMVLGRFVGDKISLKYGVSNILIVNGILIGLGMLLTLLFSSIYLKIGGCFLTGIGISTIVPLIYSQAGNQKEIMPSIAIAGVSTIAYIGFLLGPVLIGYLSDFVGLDKALFLIVALGFLAAFISKTWASKK
ncbi:MFS transporter [Aquirufa antheringensis]|uniref:MFS transporter n=1 Tax=Aquirufa antheringensis TaxID=2516559 RepID=A0A4Q9BBI3_9BACT|nr:MFS transporter [Aquirufa antheringensis]MCZ2486024.1 MFS transporter [Aquirufa antheringensis]MCZ2486285.1 MFS transporter [Aquirufa antheringensis]MCZ2488934.1 MFS transporter [Aquirufa antheringensis]TBH73197.1 MFS transporter [Aquirufa antheringensis]